MEDEARQMFEEFVQEYNRVMTPELQATQRAMRWIYPTHSFVEESYGSVEIKRGSLNSGIYSLQKFPFYTHLRVDGQIPLTQLYIDGEYWMADDPYHVIGQHNLINGYRGHVVLVGLGLGISLYDSIFNQNITKITVIELNKDLVTLLLKYFEKYFNTVMRGLWKPIPKKIEIIQGDFFDNLDLCYGADRVFVDIFTNENYHDYKPKVNDAVEKIKRESLAIGAVTRINKWVFDFNEKPIKRMRTLAPEFLNVKKY